MSCHPPRMWSCSGTGCIRNDDTSPTPAIVPMTIVAVVVADAEEEAEEGEAHVEAGVGALELEELLHSRVKR